MVTEDGVKRSGHWQVSSKSIWLHSTEDKPDILKFGAHSYSDMDDSRGVCVLVYFNGGAGDRNGMFAVK